MASSYAMLIHSPIFCANLIKPSNVVCGTRGICKFLSLPYFRLALACTLADFVVQRYRISHSTGFSTGDLNFNEHLSNTDCSNGTA